MRKRTSPSDCYLSMIRHANVYLCCHLTIALLRNSIPTQRLATGSLVGCKALSSLSSRFILARNTPFSNLSPTRHRFSQTPNGPTSSPSHPRSIVTQTAFIFYKVSPSRGTSTTYIVLTDLSSLPSYLNMSRLTTRHGSITSMKKPPSRSALTSQGKSATSWQFRAPQSPF